METKAKALAGGGNLRGYSQTEIRGGNATNLAYGLASLSVRTSLYCVGDAFARASTGNTPANLQVRVIPGQPGLTTALEFPFRARIVNVMISDVGGVADFDGQKLNRNDMSKLRKSDCVALVNWSANESGNSLARKVFADDRRKSRLNFLDPADLDGAENRIKPLKKILDEGLIDVISVNENEARILTRVFSPGALPRHYARHDIIRASANLHNALQVTVDVHTPIGSASTSSEGKAWAPSLPQATGIVTGAGDIWDAGDIVGHLLHLKLGHRLRLANACAYLYLSSGGFRLPTLRETDRFLANNVRKETKERVLSQDPTRSWSYRP